MKNKGAHEMNMMHMMACHDIDNKQEFIQRFIQLLGLITTGTLQHATPQRNRAPRFPEKRRRGSGKRRDLVQQTKLQAPLL
jgi:hypothetical protein